MEWPFKNMGVGEVVVMWDVNPHSVATAAHNTGRYKGWKFKTQQVKDPATGRVGVAVKRLKVEGEGAAPRGVPFGKSSKLIRYGYEEIAVGEVVTIRGDHTLVMKSIEGVAARERRFGIKIKRRSIKDPASGLYIEATFERVA